MIATLEALLRQVGLLLVVLAQEASPVPRPCPLEVGDEARAEAQRLLDASLRQEARGEWSAAEASLHESIRLDPASPFSPYALGLALMERKAFADAVVAFSRSREAFRCLREADPEARRRFRSRIDVQLQHLRRTVAEYERNRLQRTTVEQQEVNGDAPAPLGQSAQVVLALEVRIAELQRLRQDPQREPVALALAIGGAQFNAGALEAAEREFRAATVAEPGNGDAHNNLAVTLTLLGRLDEAERELRAAEKAGVRVSPRIRDEILRRRAAAGPS
jgi:tetratricopeptide (TPR) repeat protein